MDQKVIRCEWERPLKREWLHKKVCSCILNWIFFSACLKKSEARMFEQQHLFGRKSLDGRNEFLLLLFFFATEAIVADLIWGFFRSWTKWTRTVFAGSNFLAMPVNRWLAQVFWCSALAQQNVNYWRSLFWKLFAGIGDTFDTLYVPKTYGNMNFVREKTFAPSICIFDVWLYA